MKNNAYMPYNFNFKYEYKTYKKIGKEYKMQCKAKKNVLYKLYYKLYLFIRKIFNGKETKYKNLNNYSEWGEYVNQKSLTDKSNIKNFMFFLEEKARNCDVNRNIIGSIVTPIYVVLISGALTILLLPNQTKLIYERVSSTWVFFSVLLTFALIFLIMIMERKNSLYYFYIDYIKLIEEYESNNKRESSAETDKTEEINSKNETNTASEAAETKNYREYVVRVYDK